LWHVARIGDRKGAYSVLVGKSEGKRTLGRHMHRRKDNIKINLLEPDLIELAHHRDR